MKSSLILALLPLAFAGPTTLRRRQELAPLHRDSNAKLIEGQYIVVMKDEGDGVSMTDRITSLDLGVTADFIYDSERFRGFSSKLNDTTLSALRNEPAVSDHGI